MPTINDMVKEYNALAKRTGDPQLNSWKQDKEKLQSRINKLKSRVGGVLSGRINASKPNQSNPPRSKPSSKNPLPSIKEKIDKANELIEKEAKRVSDLISVVDVAQDLNIDPKVARAKLRRRGLKANEGRWPTFKRDSVEHKDFIKLLKGGNDE